MSAHDDLINFDPNEMGVPWATYIPHRRPEWKLHRNRSAALSVITSYDHGILYEHDNGRWVEITRKDPHDGNTTCGRCGGSVLRPPSWPAPYSNGCFGYRPTGWVKLPDGWYDTSTFDWERAHERITSPPRMLRICEACR